MTISIQSSPYLPRQRNFPNDNAQALGIELDKSYIDIASRVNERTIGIFALNFPIITGEQWFLQGQPNKQQTLRRIYTFTSTASIPHGINFTQITLITSMYGQYTDGTNWYGLIPANSNGIAGQIVFYLTPTNIVFVGAGPPALINGVIVLEWLSQI